MRIFLPVLSLLLAINCGKKDSVPKGVLSKDKMEDVLWDMIQADEFLKDYVFKYDSTRIDTVESSVGLYERVLALNKTTRQEFDSSFNYYRRHPLLMKTILDSIQSKHQSELPPPTSYPLPKVVDSVSKRLSDTLSRIRDRKILPGIGQ